MILDVLSKLGDLLDPNPVVVFDCGPYGLGLLVHDKNGSFAMARPGGEVQGPWKKGMVVK
jgi:hypothetical protein